MTTFYVYILYSEKLDRFYTGASHDVRLRLKRHNADYYPDKWTKKGKPWILFLQFPCEDKSQAYAIEAHIKRMKSKKYILNLATYPDIIIKLKKKYPPNTNC